METESYDTSNPIYYTDLSSKKKLEKDFDNISQKFMKAMRDSMKRVVQLRMKLT